MQTLVLALLLLAAPAAWAEGCPAPAWAPGADRADAELRLGFLADTFDREVRHIHIWSWSWGSTYAAATAAQLTAIPFVADGTRTDLAVGAVSAGIGSLSLFLLPLRITRPLTRVRARWAEPDRCALLADAELALFETAAIQKLSSGWIPHAGNVVVNAGLALVLGWGYGRWTSALISAAVGLVVGEANVLTQPHGLAQAMARYRRLELGGDPPKLSWEIAPMVGVGMAGVQLELQL